MSESTPQDAPSGAYEAYLERFQDAFGAVAVGAFGKHNGQLVKKMTQEEFDEQWLEYEQLYATFERAMNNGDTINDMVVRMLRESAAKLMQKAPVQL